MEENILLNHTETTHEEIIGAILMVHHVEENNNDAYTARRKRDFKVTQIFCT